MRLLRCGLFCMLMGLIVSVYAAPQETVVMQKSDFEAARNKMLSQARIYILGSRPYKEVDPIYTYYQNKDWDRAIEILKAVSKANLIEKDEYITPGILGFVTGIKGNRFFLWITRCC